MMLRKILGVMVIIAILTGTASAQDTLMRQADVFGTDNLQNGLSGEAENLMRGMDPLENTDPIKKALEIFKDALSGSGNVLKNAVTVMFRVLLIIVLCQIADAFDQTKHTKAITMSGALGIVACCASDVHAMIGLGKSTMQEISAFSDLLLPVMVSAATASGSLTGAGAAYTLTVLFSNLLIRFANVVIIPAIYAFLALSLTDSVLQQTRLKHLRDLVGWFVENGLKAVVYLFIGALTITGLLSSAADSAALKAAKFTMAGAIPVVGGIISGAASTVLSGAALLKSTIGTFGMLAVLAVFVTPFIHMGVSFLVFKVTTAIGGILNAEQSSLLEGLSSVMGYLLAMVSSCALIALLSCCSMIRTVQA